MGGNRSSDIAHQLELSVSKSMVKVLNKFCFEVEQGSSRCWAVKMSGLFYFVLLVALSAYSITHDTFFLCDKSVLLVTFTQYEKTQMVSFIFFEFGFLLTLFACSMCSVHCSICYALRLLISGLEQLNFKSSHGLYPHKQLLYFCFVPLL